MVLRLIHEVMNEGRLDVLDELYTPGLAGAARRWIAPFRSALTDGRCSATHSNVDEVYFFTVTECQFVEA